jgi:hypothetical protein
MGGQTFKAHGRRRECAEAGRDPTGRRQYEEGGDALYTTRKFDGAVAFKDSGLSEGVRVLQ